MLTILYYKMRRIQNLLTAPVLPGQALRFRLLFFFFSSVDIPLPLCYKLHIAKNRREKKGKRWPLSDLKISISNAGK